jgi:multidrug efflux pump subunit AcrA (membrane-fusion protein)
VSTPLFRSEAVAAIDAVDRLDEAMTIVSARSAFALAALLVLIAVALAWAVFGTIPVTVTGHGVFIAGAGTARVVAADDGTIQTVDVAAGDHVVAGDVIARERTAGGDIIAVRSPQNGNVVELVAQATAFVRRGDPIAAIASGGGTLRAVVFVPVASDRHVTTGLTARVAPADIAATSGRAVRAVVAAVAAYPASADRIRSALQDDALAAQFPTATPVREVELDLETTPGGALLWSGAIGAITQPTGGTPCTATILVRSVHPIELVFARNQ